VRILVERTPLAKEVDGRTSDSALRGDARLIWWLMRRPTSYIRRVH